MRLGRQITKAQKSIANRRKWVRLQTTPSATKGFLIKNSLKSTESRKQTSSRVPPLKFKKRNQTPPETALLVLGDYENTLVSQKLGGTHHKTLRRRRPLNAALFSTVTI
jgi:hypothetical protein